MFICPYYLNVTNQYNTSLWKAWIFLSEGGTKLWKTDEDGLSIEEIIDQYLKPNGFCGTVKSVKDGVIYYEVNPKEMKLDDFYSWKDFLECANIPRLDIDLWRPFIWLGKDDEFMWNNEIKSFGKLGWLEEFWKSVCIE